MGGNTVCENPVRLSLNDGSVETGIHVGKYLVHARLDYWVFSQDCRNIITWNTLLNFKSVYFPLRKLNSLWTWQTIIRNHH